MLIREHRPHLEIWRGDYSRWVLIYFSRRAAEINLAAPLQGVKGGFPGGWVSSVGHYCIGNGAGRNGLSNWRGDMEPLHVFTMDVSWGGWKTDSGLKEIGSGSWLRTDHTVAPQMNGILQKFSSHAGSITGHRCCGGCWMPWCGRKSASWSCWHWVTQHTLSHTIQQWSTATAGNKYYLLPINHSCFSPSSCLSWTYTFFFLYFFFFWCFSWLWCRFWYFYSSRYVWYSRYS